MYNEQYTSIYKYIYIVQKCFTEYTVKVFNFHGVKISQ